MATDLDSVNKNLVQLRRDVELIKNMLMAEGELTDWARSELTEARSRPRSEKLTHDEVKKKRFSPNELFD